MNDAIAVVERLWPFVIPLIAFGVWLVRLESGVKANRVSISRITSKVAATDEDVKEVEQRLHAHVAGLQVDIKQLVAEVARMSGFLMYVREQKNKE